MFMADGPCTCHGYPDIDIMRAMSSSPEHREVIQAYLASNARVLAERQRAEAQEQERLLKERRENESALDRLRRVVEEMAAAGATIRCPHCNRPAIKNDACMHMDTCPCRGVWCYCCGRALGPA